VRANLIALAVVLALGGAATWYVLSLRSSVKQLTEEKTTLVVERDRAREQVLSLTTAQDELLAKQALANKATADVKAQLAKARARVQYVQIPVECPAAVDWLVDVINE
jgi:hypothetical protein